MGALVQCSTVRYAIIQASSNKDDPERLVIAYPDENCLRDLIAAPSIVGFGFAVFTIARAFNNLWIAVLLFLLLAAISIPIYVVVLNRLDGIAQQRQETLLAELCRA